MTRDASRTSRVRLYIASFCVDAVSYGFGILLPVHAQQALDARPLTLGVLGTVSGLLYAATCFVAGRLSDRLDSRPLYLAGLCAVLFVGLPLLYFAQSLAMLVASTAVLHAGLGFFWPPLERELSFISPRHRLATTVGTFNCTWAAGICLGAGGGASFYAEAGVKAGLVLFVALSVIAFAVLLPRMIRVDSAASPASPEGEPSPAAVDPELLRRFLRIGWVANFAAYFAMRGISYLFTHVREELEYSFGRMSLLLLAITSPRLVGFLVLRQFQGWKFSLAWIVALQSVAGGGLLVLACFPTAALFFAILPTLGLFAGLSYSSSFYYGLSVTDKEGENSGVHETFLSLGATFGPLACGAVADLFSDWPGAILAFCGIVLFIALFFETVIARPSRRA